MEVNENLIVNIGGNSVHWSSMLANYPWPEQDQTKPEVGSCAWVFFDSFFFQAISRPTLKAVFFPPIFGRGNGPVHSFDGGHYQRVGKIKGSWASSPP